MIFSLFLATFFSIGAEAKNCFDILNMENKKASNPEYDQIAESYAESASSRDDRAVILVPSAKFYLGDLKGKRVLDLACGDGFFSRIIKELGAREVVAVDISQKMIDIAVEKEKRLKQGIRYHVGDASELMDFGQFDVVFAGFLLHYSSSEGELKAMIRNISDRLTPTGRFITFNENPDIPVHSGIQYGVETLAQGPVADGSRIKRVHYGPNGKEFEFGHYHFEKSTYENALHSVGLIPTWRNFVTLPGLSESDKTYWNTYINNFSITVLTAEKTRR